jgi:signal transduction histidine kinase
MKQFNYRFSGMEDLSGFLHTGEIFSCRDYQSQLVQIYSAETGYELFRSIGDAVRKVFPSAVIVGASSVGEIIDGTMQTGSTVILFSFFTSSSLNLLSYECTPGKEEAIWNKLVVDIKSLKVDVRGLFLLTTPVSNNTGKVFNAITVRNPGIPVFGGVAGDFANVGATTIYDGEQCNNDGILAVVFSGPDLSIELLTCLGWQPLSREMTITGIDNTSVKTIDGKPAFSVYENYLGIKADENFFRNSLEFPFLLSRHGQVIARTPFSANEKDGSIRFLSNVEEGEKFRIGYGDPRTIITESVQIQDRMNGFRPQAVFLFSCICRRFLMQQDVDLETQSYNRMAPAGGFYTFGEYYSNNDFTSLLNSSLVAVGFREGAAGAEGNYSLPAAETATVQNNDPFSNRHSLILSRLLYFINILTRELEEKNQELQSIVEQKNELLGIAAHDLRTPAGTILGFSGLLREIIDEKSSMDIDNELRDYTSIINRESAKMLQMLGELLDISKIEAGKLDLRKEETDYVSLLLQNIGINDHLARKKRIRIVSEVGSIDNKLFIDRDKIDQVLSNLIGNAIKYSYPDSVITVKVFQEDGNIVTQVIDQGQGIQAKEIGQIFHPFKKTSARPTNGESSHGLGLAIVKKIIEGHNGRVGVTSEYGRGSVFYFTLPSM